MDLSTFLIIVMILLIFLSIGFSIQEVKYKIAYFLILCLFGLTILNVYLSIVYYIQLRNDPGVPGDIGTKGPSGAKGMPGKCSFTQTCSVKDARNKILNIAHTMYNDIPIPCLDKPTLQSCKNNQDTLEQAIPINAQIDMLEQIAYSTTMSEEDFMAKINVCVQDSDQCMDASDF
jgi:hypothetical protein